MLQRADKGLKHYLGFKCGLSPRPKPFHQSILSSNNKTGLSEPCSSYDVLGCFFRHAGGYCSPASADAVAQHRKSKLNYRGLRSATPTNTIR